MIGASVGGVQALIRLVGTFPPDLAAAVSEKLEQESKIARLDRATLELEHKLGKPSILTCPECSGVLYELHDGELVQFRCQVGHAYSLGNFEAAQSQSLEAALWVALRALQESETLSRRLADHAWARDRDLTAGQYEKKLKETQQHADLIRRILLTGKEMKKPETELETDG